MNIIRQINRITQKKKQKSMKLKKKYNISTETGYCSTTLGLKLTSEIKISYTLYNDYCTTLSHFILS